MPHPHTDPTVTQADPDSVLLPHTGIRAPHHRFSVHDLRHEAAGSVIAYQATVSLDGHPVGRITNPRGTTTFYRALPETACTPADMAAYAARCRDAHGDSISVDDVLNALLDESETAEVVAELHAQGLTPVRLLRPVGPDHLRHVPFGAAASGDPDTWPALVPTLHRLRPLHDGEIYQIWHADAWHNLPPLDPADR